MFTGIPVAGGRIFLTSSSSSPRISMVSARGLVAPLVVSEGGTEWRYPARMPHFTVEGRRVVLDPLPIQAVPRGVLGPAIASLADDNHAVAIMTAVDEVIARGYG
jgi:hypothetical protein